MLGTFLAKRSGEGVLASHLDSFIASAIEQGYARFTVRDRMRLLRGLERWLERRSLKLVDLDEQVAGHFLEKRRRQGRLRRGHPRAISHFLEHLRQSGAIPSPEPTLDESPLATLRKRYQSYLQNERGLSPQTIVRYWGPLQRFLTGRFGDTRISVCELVPNDISVFLLRHARSGTPGIAKLMVPALRSFFRFLFQHGETKTDLAGAVPRVPTWRLAEVPKYLKPPEVEQVVHACNRNTAAARRDRAIILLLARLGLRASEVIALELDDIDWRAGVLTVRGKGGYHDRLPLPADVGEAVAVYLHKSRPRCAARRVFIRCKAPHRGFAHPSSLSTIVCRALNRAGLQPSFKGAHLLRHSLATGMLRAGASLDEIGEILRHRTPNTTEIYAKVDINGLRSLALPWPTKGGVQ